MNSPNDDPEMVGDAPPKRKRGEGKGGRFFVLNRDQWEKVWTIRTANRMNVALTYLILLAGTGSDHNLTKWSTNAISEHAGIRKDAARTAIAELLNTHLIERATSWTAKYPQYCMGRGKPKVDAEPNVTFLPVAIVTGLSGADSSVLRRVRETGDPLVLRLLIDLYGEVVMDATLAVALPKMRWYPAELEVHPNKPVASVGAHTVWENSEVSARQSDELVRARYCVKGEDPNMFWSRLKLLEVTGAIYWSLGFAAMQRSARTLSIPSLERST